MNSKFSKILTMSVAVISLTGIALFINVTFADDVPSKISSAVGPLIVFSTTCFMQLWLLQLDVHKRPG